MVSISPWSGTGIDLILPMPTKCNDFLVGPSGCPRVLRIMILLRRNKNVAHSNRRSSWSSEAVPHLHVSRTRVGAEEKAISQCSDSLRTWPPLCVVTKGRLVVYMFQVKQRLGKSSDNCFFQGRGVTSKQNKQLVY